MKDVTPGSIDGGRRCMAAVTIRKEMYGGARLKSGTARTIKIRRAGFAFVHRFR